MPVGAPPASVWDALIEVLRRELASERMARALGCDPAVRSAGFAGAPAQTLPGFRVVEAEPGRLLDLRGSHRFSRYQLTFRIDSGRIVAETRAAFPGVRGRIYRALVIGSGAHRIVTRRVLARVVRRA